MCLTTSQWIVNVLYTLLTISMYVSIFVLDFYVCIYNFELVCISC